MVSFKFPLLNSGKGMGIVMVLCANAYIAIFTLYFFKPIDPLTVYIGWMVPRVFITGGLLVYLSGQNSQEKTILLTMSIGVYILFQIVEISQLMRDRELFKTKK